MSIYDLLAGQGSDAHTVEQLLAGDTPPVATADVTVVSGQNLAVHTIVGRITTGGKIKAWDPDNNDGSETPVGIMAVAVDASLADAAGSIYVSGCFNVDQVVCVDGDVTEAEKIAAFDRTSIVLKPLTYSVG